MKGKSLLLLGSLLSTPLLAADALTGEVQRQPLNISAIVMFVVFVTATLFITYWASKRNRSASDYYAAGGRITGFQNGLAIAGDYMSAASFLGISALVYTSGYDGLIYSIGFLVGWPIILFLIAERLRNLGKYTFADVASYRLKQTSVRSLSASGSLVVVALYLIAQMVGAGKLIELLFGLQYHVAVVLVGILRQEQGPLRDAARGALLALDNADMVPILRQHYEIEPDGATREVLGEILRRA